MKKAANTLIYRVFTRYLLVSWMAFFGFQIAPVSAAPDQQLDLFSGDVDKCVEAITRPSLITADLLRQKLGAGGKSIFIREPRFEKIAQKVVEQLEKEWRWGSNSSAPHYPYTNPYRRMNVLAKSFDKKLYEIEKLILTYQSAGVSPEVLSALQNYKNKLIDWIKLLRIWAKNENPDLPHNLYPITAINTQRKTLLKSAQKLLITYSLPDLAAKAGSSNNSRVDVVFNNHRSWGRIVIDNFAHEPDKGWANSTYIEESRFLMHAKMQFNKEHPESTIELYFISAYKLPAKLREILSTRYDHIIELED